MQIEDLHLENGERVILDIFDNPFPGGNTVAADMKAVMEEFDLCDAEGQELTTGYTGRYQDLARRGIGVKITYSDYATVLRILDSAGLDITQEALFRTMAGGKIRAEGNLNSFDRDVGSKRSFIDTAANGILGETQAFGAEP